MNRFVTYRSMFIVLAMFVISIFYVGCGGSEEAVSEDEMVTDTGAAQETQTEQAPSENQKTEEQAPAVAEQQAVEPAPQQSEAPSNERLQSELDSLKTENVQLQNKLSATEQNNQELMTKISDLEAANMAMKKRTSEKSASASMSHRPAQAGKSSPEEIRAYKEGVSSFNAKKYSDAVSAFQALLNNGIKDDYADNCHYWIGLSSYQMKDYQAALSHFQAVLNYRFSEKRDDSQLMIARTYEKMGNRENAMTEYKRLVDMYPTSEYAAKAKSKLQ